jgi:hypothetical protein
VAIFTDSHEDAYGTVAWSYTRCPSARSLMALGPCTTEAL